MVSVASIISIFPSFILTFTLVCTAPHLEEHICLILVERGDVPERGREILSTFKERRDDAAQVDADVVLDIENR